MTAQGRALRTRGFREFWIVDPDERAIEQYVLGSHGFERAGTWRDRVRLHVVQEVIVDLDNVW